METPSFGEVCQEIKWEMGNGDSKLFAKEPYQLQAGIHPLDFRESSLCARTEGGGVGTPYLKGGLSVLPMDDDDENICRTVELLLHYWDPTGGGGSWPTCGGAACHHSHVIDV